MKKVYIIPISKIINMNKTFVLCTSGGTLKPGWGKDKESIEDNHVIPPGQENKINFYQGYN